MAPPIRPFPLQAVHNPHARPEAPYGSDLREILNEEGLEAARREIASWPGYTPTPLVSLPGLARADRVAAILYKDEGGRFGLASFKALGGAYAAARLLLREVAARTGGHVADTADLRAGRHRDIVSGITVCAATDGNHGRSVAWGARMFGCRCVIYIPAAVSEGRQRAMERFGAEVRRVRGNYDESVHRVAADAEANGWFVVSDTSYPGYMDIPRDVMHGYMVMADEAIRQFPDDRGPTHVFVQGGVDGLCAALCARFWWRYGTARPRFVVVEPDQAACLYESAKAGRPVVVRGDLDTMMAGLAAGEVSRLAWQVLWAGADDFLTVPDRAALELMRRLAEGASGDPPIVAGESAVAGLAGALGALQDALLPGELDLGRDSRILVFGTEGATDPELYRRIVGRPAEEVAAA